MQKYAVLVAGGSGLRMGADKPKQFLTLQGKPVLWHTIQVFLTTYPDAEIRLVLPANYIDEGYAMIADFSNKAQIQIIAGGATRFDSVKNGLKGIINPGIVFVHDGVRCLVSSDLIKRCFEQAVEKGSAIPAVAATDSIRIESANKHTVANRTQVRIIQTPQTFKTELLLPAFDTDFNNDFTDEATVVEAFGKEVFLIEGDYQNLKITRPIDLLIAEQILAERSR